MSNWRLSDNALQDVMEIASYIAHDSPSAAARLLDKIEKKCELLANNSELGERRPEIDFTVRSALVGRYVIFYRPIKLGIEVIRVVAGERDLPSLFE